MVKESGTLRCKIICTPIVVKSMMGQTLTLLHLSVPILVRSRNTDWSLVKSDNLKWKSTIFSLTNSFFKSFLGPFHGNGFEKKFTVLRSWNTEFWKFLTNKMFKKCELKVENTDYFKETVLWSLDLWVTYFICLQIGMTQIDAEVYKTFDKFFV